MSQIAYNAGLTHGSALYGFFLGRLCVAEPIVYLGCFWRLLFLRLGEFLLGKGCIIFWNMLKWGCYTVAPPFSAFVFIPAFFAAYSQ